MSAQDIAAIAGILFFFGLAFFAMTSIFTTSIDKALSIPAINESSATVEAFTAGKNVTHRFDYLILGLFIGLILTLMITAWFVGGHPIFMAGYFIVVIIVIIMSTILSNAWEIFSQASVFGTTISLFPITNNILLFLPLYMGVLGFMGLVLMFGKPYMES